MNQILFFVAGGVPLDSHKEAATAISESAKLPVRFRNSATFSDGEKLEPCKGVAGTAPDAYREKFAFYGANGKTKAPEGGGEGTGEGSGELNALGLPKGSPEDRDGLKEALEAAGVEFHANTGVEKLASLYRESVLEA